MSDSSAVDLYEVATKARSRAKPSERRKLVVAQPKCVDDIAKILTDEQRYRSPVRPRGSGSSVTRCAETASGTIVDMSLLDRVIGKTDDTITVQAGMRLRDLAEYLSDEGMELYCGCVDPNRTVGGAISSGTLGGAMPGDGAQLASSVCQISLINGLGRKIDVSQKLPDLLILARMSYGLLGIIYAVKLRIRPIRSYTVRTSKFSFHEFADIIPTLMEAQASARASLMPFRDRVYVELRYPSEEEQKTPSLSWKLRDWASNTALPSVVRSVSKAVPMKKLRDPLIDGFTEATHVLNNTLAAAGSNATEQTGRFKRLTIDPVTEQCAWFFPVRKLAEMLEAYRNFCLGHYQKKQYRCDLPAEIWRVDQDQRSLLSPSFAEPMFALNLRTTDADGWDDLLLDFADFAVHFEGVPVFNKTKGFKPGYAAEIYGDRLRRFCDMRERLDPKDRLLNQFFAEHLK